MTRYHRVLLKLSGEVLTGEKSYGICPIEINRIASEIKEISGLGTEVGIVIGGGCFPDMTIDVDNILAEMGMNIGFKLEGIYVARNMWCTKHRTVKVGQVRESVIVLEK